MSNSSIRSVPPTIAVIETLDSLRPTSIRVARALACNQSANVVLAHWHRLDFLRDRVTLEGPVHLVKTGGSIAEDTVMPALPVDALFFFGPDSGELTEKDTATLNKLSMAGIDVDRVPIYIVVDRMMLEASRRGIVTNALGSSRSWGPKHTQELRLRKYEDATNQTVTRPTTYIAPPNEVRPFLGIFAERGETCLIKPSFGEGGRDFQIIRPGESFLQSKRTVVVQRLIPDPLLVEGHKADIRFYLLIDAGNRRASGRLSPIFIRRAAVPYVPFSLPAEITNTSYRSRLGFPPDIRPLNLTPGISGSLYAEIITQLDSLACRLVDAYFWNAGQELGDRYGNDVPNRAILFGIDVLVASPLNEPKLYFLESNPFPALFRGVPDCDEAVDEMLSREYLPHLIRSGYE